MDYGFDGYHLGYNRRADGLQLLGNIAFFGVGMYVSASEVSIFYDLGLYTASYGAIKPVFRLNITRAYSWYFCRDCVFFICPSRVLQCLVCAVLLYGTLGMAFGRGAGTIEVIGAGAGIAMPFLPAN